MKNMKKTSILTAIFLIFSTLTLSSCTVQKGNTENSDTSQVIETETDTDTEEQSSEEKDYFVVSFDTDGGGANFTENVQKGNKVSKPKDPVKPSTNTTDYDFIGWYFGEEKWNFDTEVQDDITLKAKYKVTENTVGYDPSGL